MVQEQSSSHQQLPKYGIGPAATGVARVSKKNKPKKVPQRGLGVAQLEKLRIEEQKKMEGGATSRALTGVGGGGLGHLLPLHPPPPPVTLSALSRPPADGGFSPVLWDPAAADPMKHPYKRSLCPQPPLPMVSTGLSLTASSSSHHHQTEPPSNQMYNSSGSRSSAAPADDDRESAGMDRSWPFMFEGMTTAPFRTTGKATPTPPFAARMTREAGGFTDVCPDLSRHEFRTVNYLSSTNPSYSDWSSDFAPCNNSKANGEPAFLTLSAQPATLMKQQHHVIPSVHFPEYSIMKSQGSISASPSRPFYSFLPAGPVRCERPLSEYRADMSDAVDLELKL